MVVCVYLKIEGRAARRSGSNEQGLSGAAVLAPEDTFHLSLVVEGFKRHHRHFLHSYTLKEHPDMKTRFLKKVQFKRHRLKRFSIFEKLGKFYKCYFPNIKTDQFIYVLYLLPRNNTCNSMLHNTAYVRPFAVTRLSSDSLSVSKEWTGREFVSLFASSDPT